MFALIPKSSAELIVVHVGLRLAFTPTPGYLIWVNQLEFTPGTVPANASNIVGIGQQLQQELPQLYLPRACGRLGYESTAGRVDHLVRICKQTRRHF